MSHRDALPQLNGSLMLTDGGMETLIFIDGFALTPEAVLEYTRK